MRSKPRTIATTAPVDKDARHSRFLRKPKARGDEGASLILALIFIIVVSAMTTALTSWVTSDLKNTSKFTSAQSIESAANSATEAALQSVRFQFQGATINATPPAPCWTSPSPAGKFTIQEQNITQVSLSVFCSTMYKPSSTQTRTVTISTCIYSTSVAAAATCAASPLLQAVVVFNDFPSVGASECIAIVPTTTTTAPPDQVSCGTGMSIVSWAFNVVPPTVSTVSDPTTGTCSPTQTVSLIGAGFSGATSVNFVPPVSGDTILTGTNLTVASNTSLSVCASSEMVIGTTYQVSVTTPAGTSTAIPLTYDT
jgi:Tfp pilus assembly protein PilX